MDFALTDEERMLLDTSRRLIAEHYAFEYRQRVRGSQERWSRETWARLADLGLLALNFPVEEGGIGAGPVATMLVGHAIGEGLLLEPFLSSAVMATHVIVKLGSPQQRRQWLPALASGDLIAVLAHEESATHRDPMSIQARAASGPRGWRLDGHKSLTYHVPLARLLLVSARTEQGELGLFAVHSDAPGLRLLPRTPVDDQPGAEIVLQDVRVDVSARLGADAEAALQDVLDLGLAALCAEAFGAMDKLLSATIEYSRSRVQFGVPIGSFQALQHRMAEMLMHLEQARSMCYLATCACTDPDLQARRRALSAAKALMGQAARYIGQQAVQLHGGMGMTDELAVSHYFRRLLAFELRGGTTDRHLEDYRSRMQTA